MAPDRSGLSPSERLLSLLTRMRPGEGRTVLLFMLHAFLLLYSYQVVKVLRETFILTKFSAEVRSYGVAVTALVLMLLVPVYSAVRRRLDGARLLRAVTLFFAINMLFFAWVAWTRVPMAFVYFVWASVYGVMVVSQLWAFAADSFNLKSGQRLFPVIMLGANLGALVGAKTAQARFYELNDVLQYLGQFTFRTPMAAYKHSAAQFVKLRGWFECDNTHPNAPQRPHSDIQILHKILEQLESLYTF